MYSAIAANKRNTVLVMFLFVVIIGGIGALVAWVFEDWWIAVGVLVASSVYALVQYFVATRVMMAMTGARVIDRNDNPRLYNIVENLAISEGLPMPEVCVINDPAPNAFAMGKNPESAKVGATTGLLDIMDDEELRAVMAHEMAHVKNYDIRVSMVVFGLTCLVGMLSWMVGRMLMGGGNRRSGNGNGGAILIVIGLAVMILSPIFAMMVQMAVSRRREYLADASAAMMTRYPEGMKSALAKLQSYGKPMKQQNSATEAMFISSPLKKGFVSGLFSTHPPIEQRIERLAEMKGRF
ncbi:M48 family metalloprotease [Candidatus Saccharibacteria bacterium]|nr:M48 family metalloprotease [Candidatus Saccharibacteria bacterium]